MTRIHFFLLICLCAALCSCVGGNSGKYAEVVYEPDYATGFEILREPGGESLLIESRSPWQGADSVSATRLLVLAEGEDVPSDFDGQVLKGAARRVNW